MASTRAKRERTQEKEKAAMELWRGHLCDIRVDRINTPILKSFLEKRLSGCRIGKKRFAPASPRTVALDLIALRNVLKAAIDVGHLRDLPRFPKIKTPPPPRRPLLTPEEFQKLLTSCFTSKPNGEPLTKNGHQLNDFLRLLAFTGAREQEALKLRWSHVDFTRRRIFIGADENFTAAAMTIGTVVHRKITARESSILIPSSKPFYAKCTSPRTGFELDIPLPSTWRERHSRKNFSRVIESCACGSWSAECWISRFTPSVLFFLSDGRHRFYDDCIMARA